MCGFVITRRFRSGGDNGVTGKVIANARLSTDDDQDRKAGRASRKIVPPILSKFTPVSATLRLDLHMRDDFCRQSLLSHPIF